MPKQAEAKRGGVINPQNENFNQFKTREILMLSKRYESTEADRRTWLQASKTFGKVIMTYSKLLSKFC